MSGGESFAGYSYQSKTTTRNYIDEPEAVKPRSLLNDSFEECGKKIYNLQEVVHALLGKLDNFGILQDMNPTPAKEVERPVCKVEIVRKIDNITN
jgi:hypothetical protein